MRLIDIISGIILIGVDKKTGQPKQQTEHKNDKFGDGDSGTV